MATAAERLSDALIRHQIDLERLRKGTGIKFVKLLRRADAEMVAELRKRLDTFGETGPRAAAKAKSLKRLIDAVVATRRSSWIEIRKAAARELAEIAKMEAAITADLIDEAVGLEEYTAPLVAAGVVTAAVGASVWLGWTTAQHLKRLELRERALIEASVRRGIFEGAATDQIVRSVRGSRGFGMADGAINPVRNGMRSLIGSAVLNAALVGRELEFAETGVITGLIWTAVLDGRTTPICRSRDGHGIGFTDDFPEGIPPLNPPNARPPAHFNCRSFMEPTLRDIGIVKPHRTYVTETRSDRRRRIDFRAEAKRRAGGEWSGLTERQRRRRIRTVANEWARENIGTVPPQTNYADFFARQSASFQDRALGPTRGLLYRQGGLTMDQFVDPTGRTLTLEQLQTLYPNAFRRAGFQIDRR